MRMAWRCSGRTNQELVNNLKNAGIIHSPRVVAAMMEIDRGEYSKYAPYEDSPQGIGYGATISAPHMHGYALEYLSKYLHEGANVLDVGSGSGYLTACIASMVGPSGHVVGIDHVPELVQNSIRDTKKSHPEWLTQNRLKFVSGDGRLGYKKDAPYDCIHVGAASPNEPIELIEQLKSPGRLFVPIGVVSQSIMMYEKDIDGKIQKKELMGVMYVPLTDYKRQVH